MNIFRALVERAKNALLLSAATEIEADTATRATERQADLHRQAKAYEEEGLHQLAAGLRAKADALDVAKPLQAVVPGTGYLVGDDGRLALVAPAPAPVAALPPAPEKPAKKARAKAG